MTEPREHWGSKLGFILAAAGSAIGLGTMWKLPYVMGQNGGGAFILLFLLFNFLVGIPLFMAELVLGRKSQRGAVGSFSQFTEEGSPWRLVGWMSVAASIIILGWYIVVAGWGLNYILIALSDSLKGRTIHEVSETFELFRASGDLNVLWQVLFLLANATIVLGGLNKGIEYWSKLMTSSLFVVLIGLALYSSSLDGFGKALEYVLYPDFTKLTSTSVLKALGLALFTLSLGYGVMITYGSYMQKSDDIPQTSIIVGIANFFAAIMIALMIFPMVFTYGFEPQEGEGLIFKTMPYVFEQLPGSIILSVGFFSLLIFAALTSSVSMLEVSVANFIDLKGWSRRKAVLVTCVIVFVVGLPTALSGTGMVFEHWPKIFGGSFLATTDGLSDWFLTFGALFTSLFVGFKMDHLALKSAFSDGSKLQYLFSTWRFLIRYVVPAGIILVILQRARLLDSLLSFVEPDSLNFWF
jgi:NSS family neurotransmitter:Na+ symporter